MQLPQNKPSWLQFLKFPCKLSVCKLVLRVILVCKTVSKPKKHLLVQSAELLEGWEWSSVGMAGRRDGAGGEWAGEQWFSEIDSKWGCSRISNFDGKIEKHWDGGGIGSMLWRGPRRFVKDAHHGAYLTEKNVNKFVFIRTFFFLMSHQCSENAGQWARGPRLRPPPC